MEFEVFKLYFGTIFNKILKFLEKSPKLGYKYSLYY